MTTFCKGYFIYSGKNVTASAPVRTAAAPSSAKRVKVDGNIRYDFLYRSLVDTPYLQQDFSQHTVQAYMNFVLMDAYPVRATITGRRSNSPYFQDMADVNIEFRGQHFLSNAKEKMKKLAEADAKNRLEDRLSTYQREYAFRKDELGGLRQWIDDPVRKVEILADRERAAWSKKVQDTVMVGVANRINSKLPSWRGGMNSQQFADSAKEKIKESATAKLDTVYKLWEARKKELTVKEEELRTLNAKMEQAKKQLKDSLEKIRKEINAIKDGEELNSFTRKNKHMASALPKGWQLLGALNQVSLGRTWLDISELTVRNISLTGGQVEFNPSKIYLAAGAGRVNARYRDFVLKNKNQSVQPLFFIRSGWGRKAGSNVILTYYNGKKSLFATGNTGSPNTLPVTKVMGLSVESRVQVNRHTWISLEVARSSYYGNTGDSSGSALMQKVWNLGDRSNEAYSIKAGTYFPSTNTRFQGNYRKSGLHFQSFNLQPVNSEQEAYNLRIQQAFWSNKLQLEAGIRKNDFNNPLIAQGINSKTVFKTATVTVRVPRYPMLSVSYFPSSQLTIIDGQTILENQYNALSAVMNYGYGSRKVRMNTSAVFLKFFNTGSDTGFIYYNTSSLAVQQFITVGRFQFQSGMHYSWQPAMQVFSADQSASWQVTPSFMISAGGRYNRVLNGPTLWGGLAGVNLTVKNIGVVQLLYDKSYLPGTNRNLLPLEIGRVGFQRNF